MKKILSAVLAICIIFSLAGCGSRPETTTGGTVKTIVDSAGRSVEIPTDIDSVCCVCPYSGSLIVMLGKGDIITTTCNNVARSNLLLMICPELENASVVKNSGAINAEEILAAKTDIIIAPVGDTDSAILDELGIPYVLISCDTLEDGLESIEILGEVFDEEEKAGEYVEWSRNVYSDVEAACAQYEGETIRLYHSVNEALRTDYEGSICAEWIAKTGVTNVSLGGELEITGSKAYATLEQIYEWDPEVIICNEAGIDSYILRTKAWGGLTAVEEGRVYQIPVGISRMGHPTSTETPLAAMWLANTLYPELYSIDFKSELKDYYERFYDYTIDDELADAIIEGTDMRQPKNSQNVE